eukprot:TRINITY_DN10544_c0_g1_i1.p1 TRINITY_DN10544_c0_g1~~TRINITY_DN10544_c0_g1_i1.p1  ORF type:complete len:120 (-),score=16.80 TRINITY_DN10544_c0_g1_i1:86-445(-)
MYYQNNGCYNTYNATQTRLTNQLSESRKSELNVYQNTETMQYKAYDSFCSNLLEMLKQKKPKPSIENYLPAETQQTSAPMRIKLKRERSDTRSQCESHSPACSIIQSFIEPEVPSDATE